MNSGEVQKVNAIAPIYPIVLSGLTLAVVSFVISHGITLNQALAFTFILSILTVWFYDKFKSVMLGLVFFISKPFWIRLAFGFDYRLTGEGGFDLLGITPA